MKKKTVRDNKWLPLILLTTLSLCLSGCSSRGSGKAGIGSRESCYYNGRADAYSPGWYRGDLHSHARYHFWNTPVSKVVAIAEDQGFDFFAITNHNDVFQWRDPGYRSDKLTILYGVEWTSPRGHANVWSNLPGGWDAIKSTAGSGDVDKAIESWHSLPTRDRSLLFSINHPDLENNEWKASREESRSADAIEVWNGSSVYLSPTGAIASYLSHGLKMAMVGGSDAHLGSDDGIGQFAALLGRPTTWVFADSKSGKDILEGIRKGHVYVSATPEGPRVGFFAGTGKSAVMMGDALPADALNAPEVFTVSVSHADAPYGVIIMKNGMSREEWSRRFSKGESSFSFTDIPRPGDYYLVVVRQLAGPSGSFQGILQEKVMAITNPIYTW